MAIRVFGIEFIPMMDENNVLVDKVFVTLQIKHDNLIVANPRVPLEMVPEGTQVGDELQFVKV